MKKTYIIPTLNVVKIQPACMLNESMGIQGNLNGDVTEALAVQTSLLMMIGNELKDDLRALSEVAPAGSS